MKRYITILLLLLGCFKSQAQNNIQYEYDAVQRLSKATYSNGVVVQYTYDELGNRLLKVISGNTCQTATATLTGTQTVSAGQSANLVVTYSGALPYSFVFNGQGYANINTPTYTLVVTPSQTTTYTLTSVTNACGAGVVSGNAIVTIPSACPTPTGTAIPSTISAGQSSTISLSNCAGTVTWSENLGTGSTKTVLPLATIVYSATCTTVGCPTTITSIRVSVACAAPAAPSISSTNINSGQTATLTASGCAGTVYWYDAPTGGNYLSTGLSYTTPSLSTSTIYYATCVVNNCESIAGSGTVTVGTPLSKPLLVSPLNISNVPFTGSITLQWATNSNPTGTSYFPKLRDLTTGNLVFDYTDVGSATSYVATVVAGHSYRWVVQARKTDYIAGNSDEFTFYVQAGTYNLQLGACIVATPNPLVQEQNKSFTYSVKNTGTVSFIGTIKLTINRPNGTFDVVDEHLNETISPNQTVSYTTVPNILSASNNPVGVNYQFTVVGFPNGAGNGEIVNTTSGCTNPLVVSVVANPTTNPCPPTASYPAGTQAAGIYSVGGTIISIAKPANPTIYIAGSSITMNPGFVAEKGNTFTAKIQGCVSTAPTSGLVVYYPFNGNANDASGNSNNGTVTGATLTTDRFGVTNKAYSFVGNSYITGSVAPLTNATVSLWFKTASVDYARYPKLFSYGLEALTAGINNSYDNGANCSGGIFSTGGSVGINNCGTSPNYANNVWHHAVFIFNSATNTHTMYVNGILKGTATMTTAIPSFTYFDIARANNGCCGLGYWSELRFTGQIDEFRIYNRALSPAEALNIYNAER